MRVLLALGNLNIGGIQTYIVRLANKLAVVHEVKILILSRKYSDDLLSQLAKSIQVFFIGDFFVFHFPFLERKFSIAQFVPLRINSVKKDLQSDVVFSVDSDVNIIALKIASMLDARLNIGAFHPREFTWHVNYYFRRVQLELLEKLPRNNISFMSLPVKIENNQSGIFTDCPVVKLGVDTAPYMSCNPIFLSDRIVSVGRLVDFKTYNRVVIESIDSINKITGRCFEYHIYGSGPEEDYLKSISVSKSSKIHFHGNIEYGQMKYILNNSFCFVGVGTAAVEAAASGLPVIVGTDSSTSIECVNGFIYDLPDGNLGESCSEGRSISNLVAELTSSEANYQEIARRSRQVSDEYDINIASEKYGTLFSTSCYFNSLKFSKLGYLISYLSWIVINQLRFSDSRKTRYFKTELSVGRKC